jgi:predicted ATPase
VRIALIGDAGVGKSRLVREFRARVTGPVQQLVAHCASFEAETPYALLAHLLRRVFGVEPGTDEKTARTALERGCAGIDVALSEPERMLLLHLLGYDAGFPYSPEARRAILVRLLRQILQKRAAQGPLLVIAEDLHWADTASLTVLNELARDIPSQPCLLLVTARPPWRPEWPTEQLDLAPLPEDEARALASHLLGTADHTTIERLLTQAGGNPFMLEEVVLGGGPAETLDYLPDQAGMVPPRIQEVLQARLDRLPMAAKSVLRLAAVCGRGVRARVLEHLVPAERLAEGLRVLMREGLLMPATSGERGYAFRHALIQEVAYTMQLKAHRQRTHAAVGAALSSSIKSGWTN